MTSPASAYRNDRKRYDTDFSTHDGDWLTVAILISHAATLGLETRAELLRDAIELAEEIIGAPQFTARGHREWMDRDRTASEVLILLADDIEQAGAFHLAAAVLDALLVADTAMNTVQQARVLAQRARVTWKLGDLDEAADRCMLLRRMARQTANPELGARAWISSFTVAQLRGNLPDMQRCARRAAAAADRGGLIKLSREAHTALMIVAGMRRDVDEALAQGWTVFTASAGHPIDEAETLANLGQVLLDAGHGEEARAAFACIATKELPARILLPALGGLALASARCDDDRTVSWACDEVEAIDSAAVPRWSLAMALLECADAATKISRSADAERLRARALDIARVHGFHEVVFRAELLVTEAPSPRRAGLRKRAAQVAQNVSWMEPAQLPQHVRLAAAPV